MNKYLFLIAVPAIVLLFAFTGGGQTRPMNISPVFPGGDTALICFYKSNLPAAIVNDTALRGTYMIQFIVDTSGQTRDAKITNAPPHSEKAQQELIRVTHMLPKWTPGYSVGDIYTDEETGKKHLRVVQLNYPVRLPQVNKAVCPEKK